MNSTRKSGWRKVKMNGRVGLTEIHPARGTIVGKGIHGMEGCGYGRKYVWTEERKDRRIERITPLTKLGEN